MSSTEKSSSTSDQPESAKPTGHMKSEARHRRLCKAARLICVLVAIGLSISAIVCLIMSIMAFAAAPSASGKLPPDGSLLPEVKVGDSECHSYVAFGENYNWPTPQLRLNHHAYRTLTEMDETSRSFTWHEKSKTTLDVEAWTQPGIAEQRTASLTMAQASAPGLLYPGLLHQPCAANVNAISKPLITLDTISQLSWHALYLFVVVQMYRLFSHCLSGSILDVRVLGICRKMLNCYAVMLLFGPISLYAFNLFASSGVAHILPIPYAGIVLWLVLCSMHALMRKASHLKTEVDATI